MDHEHDLGCDRQHTPRQQCNDPAAEARRAAREVGSTSRHETDHSTRLAQGHSTESNLRGAIAGMFIFATIAALVLAMLLALTGFTLP